MHRFLFLERKINKGIKVDEKSNQVIQGWTPNNIKRLIVGFNFAIIQYHKTGGKYTRLTEIVQFKESAQKDILLLQEDPSKYKPILGVLTAGRICSSIEEIVIHVDHKYPQHILKLDTNITDLAKGNTTLENRFVRLRHISLATAPVKELSTLANNSMQAPDLMLTHMEQANTKFQTLVSQHEDDWWKGSSLRPKYYQMDATVLPDHFEAIKEKAEKEIKEEKLNHLDLQRNAEAVKKSNRALKVILRGIFEILTGSDKIYQSTPLLSKAEWSHVLEIEAVAKGVRKELLAQEELIQDARRIDFQKIIETTSSVGLTGVDMLEDFEEYLFDAILKDKPQYKRDSNKDDIRKSIQTLQKITGFIFNVQVNIVYLAFIKYLTRNTPKHAEFFYTQLNQPPSELNYTRSTMAFCNKYLEEGWSKQAMEAIPSREVLVEEFTIQEKYKYTLRLLQSLLAR